MEGYPRFAKSLKMECGSQFIRERGSLKCVVMKSLGKAKVRWIWCSKSPRHVEWLGWERIYRLKDGKVIRKGPESKVPSRISCPDCGLRFIPRVRPCHDAGCMHLYVPAHKKKEKIAQDRRGCK